MINFSIIPGIAGNNFDRSAGNAAYKQNGIKNDPLSLKYWNSPFTPLENDQFPRRNLNNTSEFIHNVSYIPEANTAMVQVGGRTYSYFISPDQLGRWLNSSSLGKYYNENLKHRG